MNTEVSYRAAATSDIDCLLQLMLGLQQDDPWSVPFREEVVRESLRELLINPSVGRGFLICDADFCVGYVVVSFDYQSRIRRQERLDRRVIYSTRVAWQGHWLKGTGLRSPSCPRVWREGAALGSEPRKSSD